MQRTKRNLRNAARTKKYHEEVKAKESKYLWWACSEGIWELLSRVVMWLGSAVTASLLGNMSDFIPEVNWDMGV